MGVASPVLQLWLLLPAFINGQNFPSDHGVKKLTRLKKIYASRGCCEMHANQFGVCGLSGFGDVAPFCLPSKTAKISFSDHGLYSPWGQKIESAQKNSCK